MILSHMGRFGRHKMFPVMGGQGTRIIKREGIAEEFGLRVKWAGVIIFAMDLAVAACIAACLLIGYICLPILAIVVSFAIVFLLGYLAGWDRGGSFLYGCGLAFFAGSIMAAVGADLWEKMFGEVGASLAAMRVAVNRQWNLLMPWGLIGAGVVWFLIVWIGKFSADARRAASGIVMTGGLVYFAISCVEVARFLAETWKVARYFLLAFLWPVPVGAVLLVLIAIQEMFMPNASVTLSPLKLNEWKSLGPFGLGFFFKRLRGGEGGAAPVDKANRYEIQTTDDNRLTFEQIPYPRVGGAGGLARYYAAIMAGRATISEAGSKTKKGQTPKYKGAVAYGYSQQQWRNSYIDPDGVEVSGLKDALFESGLVEKVGLKTRFTEEGAKHAAEFVRDHLGIGAVAEKYKGYLD